MVGVDCPTQATYLKASHWVHYEQKALVTNSICVFEEDMGDLLWRKVDEFYQTGGREHQLIIRIPSTIGNYDYIFEFRFHLDGTMETKVTASGYIQGVFFDENNPNSGANPNMDAFGYRVAEYTHGAMHDHSFGFKVDIDVAGRDNSFQTIHWKQGDPVTAINSQRTRDPISEKLPYFYESTRYLEYIIEDAEFARQVNLQENEFWVMINEESLNAWGVPRGYRLILTEHGTQNLDSVHPILPAMSFSNNHLAITKYKDNERHLTDPYDMNRLSEPVAPFDAMLNGENIRNNDLVAWVTLNFLHIPTSEDYPITHKVSMSYTLKPFNYFDRYQGLDIPHFVNLKTDFSNYTEMPPQVSTCIPRVMQPCYNCNLDSNDQKDDIDDE